MCLAKPQKYKTPRWITCWKVVPARGHSGVSSPYYPWRDEWVEDFWEGKTIVTQRPGFHAYRAKKVAIDQRYGHGVQRVVRVRLLATHHDNNMKRLDAQIRGFKLRRYRTRRKKR